MITNEKQNVFYSIIGIRYLQVPILYYEGMKFKII